MAGTLEAGQAVPMPRYEAAGLCWRRVGGPAGGDGLVGAPAEPEVLHDIRFQRDTDAFRWLLRPSAASKISVLRVLTLAVRRTRVRLGLMGVDVTTASRRALPPLRSIGVVSQDHGLWAPRFSVLARGLRICTGGAVVLVGVVAAIGLVTAQATAWHWLRRLP